MTDSLVTKLVVQEGKTSEAIAYFKGMQADVLANEPDVVFYSFFQQKDKANTFWVMEVFKDEKATAFHLDRHNWRMPDFDKILAEPAEFNAVVDLPA